MISEKQKKIIKLLLTHKQGYHVNQIARILNISVSWVHETLKHLESEGILVSEKLANSLFYKLNFENPKTEKIVEYILLDTSSQVFQEQAENKPQEKQAVSLETKQTYQTVSQQNDSFKGYLPLGNSSTSSGSVYGSSSNTSFDYSPLGSGGVNSVLASYASAGAFGGNFNYSGANTYISGSVPSATLGSKVSTNVSGFTQVQHTSAHKIITVGCRYCGPEPNGF